MGKRSKLAALLEEGSNDPALKAAAVSAAAAGGVIAAGTAIRDRVAERRRKRSRRYRLKRDETPAQGIGRIARGQLDLTIDLLESSRNGSGNPEAVHDARKALKRLRALLRVSRGMLKDQRYSHENVILRDAGRALSDARDAQVLLDTLDSLRKEFADEVPQGAWSRLREELVATATTRQEQQADASGNVVGALSDTHVRVATWPLPDEGGPESLAGGFARVYRRGRRALRAAEAEPSTENLHELRKRAKDFWHAAQLLRPTCPRRMKKLQRKAHRLSDLLGDDHDLSVLHEHARRHRDLLDSGELELLSTLVERRRTALRRDALARAKRLYRRKPRKLIRRLALA